MKDFLEGHKTDSAAPDTPTPLNSEGGYRNAAGSFDLKRELRRKVKSRAALDQPAFTEDDAITRYYGDFSIESKRHVWDLLQKHPRFGKKENGIQLNRTYNNTKDVIGGVTKTSDQYY